MPEILIRIVMEIYKVSSEEAEEMLRVESPEDTDDE